MHAEVRNSVEVEPAACQGNHGRFTRHEVEGERWVNARELSQSDTATASDEQRSLSRAGEGSGLMQQLDIRPARIVETGARPDQLSRWATRHHLGEVATIAHFDFARLGLLPEWPSQRRRRAERCPTTAIRLL